MNSTDLTTITRFAFDYFANVLHTKQVPEATEFFNQYHLSKDTINKFSLGFDDGELCSNLLRQFDEETISLSGLVKETHSGKYCDKFENRLIFPIMDEEGAVKGFIGRSLTKDKSPIYLISPETNIFRKSSILYGLNVARETEGTPFILCEGILDVIALHQHGYLSAICPLGTSLSVEQAETISRFAEKIYLLFDNDSTGAASAEIAEQKLCKAGVKATIIHLPGFRDPIDAILAGYNFENDLV